MKRKTTKQLVKELKVVVNSSHLKKKFINKEPIAKINGPAIVIEAIIQDAARNGIDMDWCYYGGRGFIFADGDPAKARRELFLSMPQSDLSINDL